MGEDIVGVEVVAPSIYNRSNRFGEMTKKRDLTYDTYNHQRLGVGGGGRGVPMDGNWNPKIWDWDPVKFAAKPLEESRHVDDRNDASTEDEQNLRLNLGSCTEDPVPKPSKRIRSGSPGNNSYPMCQVDSCREDLSNAKDYHRRHKVCEIHSKATKALVGKQMQRFCQQCSRFHPLSEFDEGKRSCRRRLAGHNRRRRKTQPEDVTSKLSVPGNPGNAANKNLDIVNLLTVLARAQGNDEKISNCPQVTDKEQLIQILNKINSLPLTEGLAAEASKESLRKIIPDQTSELQSRLAPSTMDLLGVLSSNSPPHAPSAALTQGSSHSSDSEKTKSAGLDQSSYFNTKKLDFPSAGLSSTSYQSPLEDSDGQFQETQVNLPLQLFSSSPESGGPPKLPAVNKYFSSDSSNPTEDMSPSSSPVQKLFPVQASKETLNSTRNICRVSANVVAGRSHGSVTSFDLFRGSIKGTDIGSFQSSPYQAGYTSSSGSDHSPSSTSSDSQDRTGRIIFKLFDKDPSHFPRALRAQIYSWLANSPSEMESYIRPGCVVLSIYIAMPLAAWEKLEENLLWHVNALVQDSVTDFWRGGRFLISTDKQLVSHKDGKLRLCKSWISWGAPKLISVSPLAVVGGQETLFILRGRNLNSPGTKIHCTYMGGYTSDNISASTSENLKNEMDVADFRVHFAAPSAPSRCFIEVENGFKGNSFPVIVADSSICRELRLLESEFEEDGKTVDVIWEDQMPDVSWSVSRVDALHFLNELGWLFQRKKHYSDYSLNRFKYLLIFSVERSFCALVKFLLDILVEGHKGLDGDGLSVESLNMLSDGQLLSRAVKMKCKKMVDLLVNYSIIGHDSNSRTYIFSPNLVGPGGLTPLHLAACTEGSDETVDALTNDPLEIGLQCWSLLLDANGRSPFEYAALRNNHSYNRLVAQKVADRKNGQVSVSIEMEQPLSLQDHGLGNQFNQGAQSCGKCALVVSMYQRRIPGAGLLYRPYIHSMLAIAAVCVCVCLFLRGSPDTGLDGPFKWENLDYGTS